jgi:hypothetical protein
MVTKWATTTQTLSFLPQLKCHFDLDLLPTYHYSPIPSLLWVQDNFLE